MKNAQLGVIIFLCGFYASMNIAMLEPPAHAFVTAWWKVWACGAFAVISTYRICKS